MTISDGLGTYARIWSDGIWIFVSASMKVETAKIAVLIYLFLGWGIYRWRRSRRAK